MDNTKPEAEVTKTEETTVEETDVEETASTDESPEEAPASEDDSSSQTEGETDYQSLIEAEKKSGQPDPQKAYERFKKKRERGGDSVSDDTSDDYSDDLDKPMTRREAEEFFARQRQQVVLETNQDRLADLASQVTTSPEEAEYVLAVHANRVFPEGMTLKEQIEEAHAIANYKRVQAKNRELARAVQSSKTVARTTATTQRDAQKASEPGLSAEMKTSLKRAGYTYNNQTKQYEKKLPNGKTLATRDGKNPQLVG